jgi:hypothetical protein
MKDRKYWRDALGWPFLLHFCAALLCVAASPGLAAQLDVPGPPGAALSERQW